MQELSTVAAAVTIINAIGGWPLVTILATVFVLPALVVAYAIIKLATALIALRDEVRADNVEANSRYDNNVILVENYQEMAKELIPIIQVNTEAMTRLRELIKFKLKDE